jgi:methylisocitrate lyase
MALSKDSPEALLAPRSDKPAQLRALLNGPQLVRAPGAFNAISAKIIEDVGFPALYISGAGLANGVFGYPDVGMLSATEMAQLAGAIAQAVNIPAIADADTGYGEALNVFRTVQLYERAGLSGLHLEDQVSPKRCGHLSGKQVIAVDAMVEKIQAACAARQNPDFLLIARVDSRAVNGLEDALMRTQRYIEAGADMIFPEALENAEEFQLFADTFSKQTNLMANMTEFGKSPLLSTETLQAMGFKLVIYPLTAFRVMMKAVEGAMRSLLASHSQEALLANMTNRQALYQLIHYQDYDTLPTVTK